MANPFLPQFKNKTQHLLESFAHKPAALLECYQRFIASEGKSEAEVTIVLQQLFNTLADQLHNQDNKEAYEKMLSLFDFLATTDEGMRKEVNQMKELVKQDQDAIKKKAGRHHFLSLLRNQRFAQFCAELLCRKIKSQEEKVKAVSDRLKQEFGSINDTMLNNSIYQGWGALGVQFINLLHAAIQMLAAKAGYDIPGLAQTNPDASKGHMNEGYESMMPNPNGPKFPPIPSRLTNQSY